MPAVKVRCSNPNCRKSYLLKDESLPTRKVCRACGSQLATVDEASQTKDQPVQSAVATVAPRGDTEEIPLPESVGTTRPHESESVEKVHRGGSERESPTTPAANPSAGAKKTIQRLGRFEIRGKLGAGAFGLVYRAYDPLLSRELAIKVPQASALEKPDAAARFLREPKAAAQLRHPHIVPVYDAGVEAGQYYVASAFIDGTTLGTALENRTLEFREAAKIVLDLAEALHYAHRLGVVHRDIKPANIMLDHHGNALLMDFGLARVESTEEVTEEGALLGTPAYMAPEQAAPENAARDQAAVGPHSDQYSLGVVLYELLCGQRPFSGPPAVIVYNAIHEPPPPPRSVRHDIPADLETICLKTLSKQPAERYANCEDVAADLRRWLDDEPIKARQLGLWERASRWTRRNPVLGAMCGAVAVLALVSTFVAVSLLALRINLFLALRNEGELTKYAQEQSMLAQEKTDLARKQEKLAQRNRQVAQTKKEEAVQNEKLALSEEREAQLALDELNKEIAKREKAVADAELAAREKAKNAEKLAASNAETEDAKIKQAQAEAAAKASAATTLEGRWQKYCKLLAKADEEFQASDYEAALATINSCPLEQRGWEWRVFKRLCSGETADLFSKSLVGPAVCVSQDGSLIVAGGAVYQMPEMARLPTSAPSNARLVFSPDGKSLAHVNSRGGADEFIEVATGIKHAAEAACKVPGSLGNGLYFVVKQTGKQRSLIAHAYRPKLDLKEKQIFPAVIPFDFWLSRDGEHMFVLGVDREDREGLFHGTLFDEPKFVELDQAAYQAASQKRLGMEAHSRLALLSHEHSGGTMRRGFLNCRNGALDWHVLSDTEMEHWVPISLSPDSKRLLVASVPILQRGKQVQVITFKLVDLETGLAVPNLSFFPWMSRTNVVRQVIPAANWESMVVIDERTWDRWQVKP